MKNIRNFCIIAHIDHGKSTLADRLLEYTGTVSAREMTKQVLDDMDLEQERGITIKLHAIPLNYKSRDGQQYTLNLIDTPGHVDFTYEVSRSLAACEGAILVVDATQGVEAQTISNLYLAVDAGLEIIPFINKIDLPSAKTMIDTVKKQVIDLIGCKEEEILMGSAKSGIGTENVLEAIVRRIPAPGGDPNAPLRALIFDSVFDEFRGAVAYVRIVDGTVKERDKIRFFSNGKEFQADDIGVLEMQRKRTGSLSAGDVGYIIASVRDVHDTKVGDTITLVDNPASGPLPGYKEVKPMVFSGIYPSNSDDFTELREALEKLKLNDASLVFEPESSLALGFGFRAGFLGLLHMEIIRERLEREYNQSLINTVPNVEYRVTRTNGEVLLVDNPALFPNAGVIEYVEEPYVKAQIITPTEYIGSIMKLCMDRRGIHKNTTYLSPTRADIYFELPLAEIIFDFYDKLKSMSRGYASFDYDFIDYRQSNLVKLDILLNTEPVDALSTIVHRTKSYEWGRKLCSKLKELIPRQMFEVAIQAAIGSKVIARETISAMRKNVLAKCYGGDISRKRKLLEKQKEGKKRMKQVGRVEIPQEAFLAVLSMDE
ncbi:MAG: elongation factor 4 [Ignavibacteria bacterium GWA2_55_11]|nr:MAG: elongation factor 4 [Ignavibacteria bacterium GWA2_55_11]OGU64857.1 MAG: elongation factor 4 [Ignavibacteria bacterium RIFCSPHIGHO2_02_FULL_56_12]OGU72095.1 MAG: elongation factor 4 [Ignavibacteria bacterium RIFCSPLOWO2_02_FULL_55_14]OGU73824.1 MAG: elongation factor 4 [Ignavibacteria bacterium RIFCSPLOWO2_12_FULL_56_21]